MEKFVNRGAGETQGMFHLTNPFCLKRDVKGFIIDDPITNRLKLRILCRFT